VWVRPKWLAEDTLRINAMAGEDSTWGNVDATEEVVTDSRGLIRTHDQPWETRIWRTSRATVGDLTDVLTAVRGFLQHSGLCTVIECAASKPNSGGASPPPPATASEQHAGSLWQGVVDPAAIKWKPNLFERRVLSMIYIPPASVEVGGQDYQVPLQGAGKTPDTSGFALIPNGSEKVTHTFKFNMVRDSPSNNQGLRP